MAESDAHNGLYCRKYLHGFQDNVSQSLVAMARMFESLRNDLKQAGLAGWMLLVLLLAVGMNRYRVDAVPLRPQLEHFALVLAFAALALMLFQKKARLAFDKSDALLAAYLFLALISSLVFPAEPRESVQYWARMVLAVVVYFVTRWLLQDNLARVRLILKALLVFGVGEAWFGIVGWFLYPFGINLGVDQYPLGIRGPGGILCNFSLTMYGTLWEPNVFGSTLMMVGLFGATLFVSNSFVRWRNYLGSALLIILIALGLNASRGVLLTLAFGLVLVLVFAGGMAFTQKLKWAALAAGIVLVVAVASQELAHDLMQLPTAPGLAARAPCAKWIAEGMPRGTQAGDPEIDPATGPESEIEIVNRVLEGQTVASRLVSYRNAWKDFLQRPWLGLGANSFGQKYTTTAHTPGWISNLTLMSLHDTGILGTIILFAWFIWFALTCWRGLRNSSASTLRTMLFGLGIGLVGLFVAYQVTTMLWFGLIWYWAAVLRAGVKNPEQAKI